MTIPGGAHVDRKQVEGASAPREKPALGARSHGSSVSNLKEALSGLSSRQFLVAIPAAGLVVGLGLLWAGNSASAIVFAAFLGAERPPRKRASS